MKQLLKNILPVLLFLWSTGVAAAFAQDDTFNPANPPEPNALYKVEVVADDADGGNVSGTGNYREGTSVRINASCKSGFKFIGWKKYVDGVFAQDLTTQSFYHTVTANKVRFVAYFEYDPASPADPSYTPKYKVYLRCTPDEACSFNINSGSRFDVNTNKTITAYPSQGFVFLGWYDDFTNELLSQNTSFTYRITADAHFTARFEYNPTDPSDPTSNQTEVHNPSKGDVDQDGEWTINDVMITCNYVLKGGFNALADVDNDGEVTINDVMIVCNYVLKGGPNNL